MSQYCATKLFAWALHIICVMVCKVLSCCDHASYVYLSDFWQLYVKIFPAQCCTMVRGEFEDIKDERLEASYHGILDAHF